MASWQSRLTAFVLWWMSRGARAIDVSRQDPAQWRAGMDGLALRMARLPEGTTLSPVSIGRVPGQWVEVPESHPYRVIYYLHGGGYVFGSAATHQGMVARLCKAARARALMVDYRLAPEHPYPAAVEDALNGYHWMLTNGINPGDIVVAGDSAGGGLALALMCALRDHGSWQPAAGVLLSPWTDLALTGWSHHANARSEALLDLRVLSYCAQLYLRGIPPTDPLASPLYGDLGELAPLLIHAAEREVLYDDALRVAQKAEAAGVDVTFEAFDTSLHVPHFFAPVPEGQAAVERVGLFIRQMTEGDDIWSDDDDDDNDADEPRGDTPADLSYTLREAS